MKIKIFKNKNLIYYNEYVESIEFSDNTLTLNFDCGKPRIFFKVEFDELKIEKQEI